MHHMTEAEEAAWQQRREAERVVEQAAREAFYATMRAVAALMGYTFYLPDEGDSWLRAVDLCDPHQPGYGVYARLDKGRIKIGGLFQDGHAHVSYGRDDTGEISTSATRSAVEIAKEIRRRLLPSYAVTRAKALARKAGEDAKTARTIEITARLTAAAGPTARHVVKLSGDTAPGEFTAGEGYPAPHVAGEVSVYRGELVDLRFTNLPVELAEQLLLMFGEYCT